MFDIRLYSLSQLTYENKDKVLQWRNQDRIRKNMYTDHIISEEEHENWIKSVLCNSSKAYLVSKYKDKDIGLVYFYDIDLRNYICKWGFYVGEESSPQGSGFVIELLALEFAFENLKIRKLCCEVFLFNQTVIKQHKRFGFQEEGILKKHILKEEVYEDIVLMSLFSNEWPNIKQNITDKYITKTK